MRSLSQRFVAALRSDDIGKRLLAAIAAFIVFLLFVIIGVVASCKVDEVCHVPDQAFDKSSWWSAEEQSCVQFSMLRDIKRRELFIGLTVTEVIEELMMPANIDFEARWFCYKIRYDPFHEDGISRWGLPTRHDPFGYTSFGIIFDEDWIVRATSSRVGRAGDPMWIKKSAHLISWL